MSETTSALFEQKHNYLWVKALYLDEQGEACLPVIEEAALKARQPPQLAIDFEKVEYVNSILLSMLIRLKKRIEESGGVICLVNLSDYCEELLEKLKLNTVFTTYKTYRQFNDFQKSIESETLGDCIHLTGNITVSSADEVRIPMKKMIDSGVKNVSIDMSHVKIIDSIGIGEIIRFTKVLKNKGGSLKLINVGKDIHEFLVMLHLDKHLEIRKI
jgi:anti-anti-sigma factor